MGFYERFTLVSVVIDKCYLIVYIGVCIYDREREYNMDPNLVKFAEDWSKKVTERARKIRESYKPTVEDIAKFQNELDALGMHLVQQQFPSFVWMDHYRKRVVGTTPQFFIVANTSDGTYNLIKDIPVHAVSLSFLRDINKPPVLSYVYDTFNNKSYWADTASYEAGKPIRTTKTETIEDSTLSVDPKDACDSVNDCKVFRRFGSLSLELCWLAAGKLDGVIYLSNAFDMAYFSAPLHILEKAGGKLTLPNGKPFKFEMDFNTKSTFVASANEVLHRRLLEKVKA